MSDYRAPYRDTEFVLTELVGFDDLCQAVGLDEINMDLASGILEEAGKFASEVIAPSNRDGDLHGARLDDQGVRQTPGFAEIYQQFAGSGWLSLAAEEEFGGQNLPHVLSTAVNELWHSANMAFALCPMLSQGAMEAIGHHASPELKAAYLPNMISGAWTGTMNITEPDAGSDLAAIKCRAIPEGDHYRVSGQKIFITWGDHQMTPNIVHLVLARLPDAPAGVKGISLFIVPKFLLDDGGEPGEANGVSCLSLEHKLGIHGSPTCVMEFDNAIGYLVGEANKGLMYMFTMMNNARQAVGLQGLSISERAYQQALQYAKERLQGMRRDGSRIPIIQHPDVRRMLMFMKASIEAMRALALVAAAELDLARHAQGEAAATLMARAELYTPIVKGWLSEMAQELTSLGIQIYGGMGFVEEAGAAQHYRDARILPIYEGTTGIQALDFAGRKTLANQGLALASLLDDMHQTLADAKAAAVLPPSVLSGFATALVAGQASRERVLTAGDALFAPAVAFNFLLQFGYLCGGWLMLRSALKAMAKLEASQGDPEFLTAKRNTAWFYCEHLLPRSLAHAAAVIAGSASLMSLTDDQF